MTQTVGKSDGGGSFVATNLIPFGGGIEFENNDFIVYTFSCKTRITLQTYVVFRFYRWWTVLNYRVIVRYKGAYRAVDFRGRHQFRNPTFFEDLGYSVERVDKFWRRSSDELDERDYDLSFWTS